MWGVCWVLGFIQTVWVGIGIKLVRVFRIIQRVIENFRIIRVVYHVCMYVCMYVYGWLHSFYSELVMVCVVRVMVSWGLGYILWGYWGYI